MYKVEIQPAGVSYNSKTNLLDDALSSSLPLEHSCKTGDCGVCSAEVLSGSVENENGEIVTAGRILVCQSKATSDTTLQAQYYPELAQIKRQTLPCKISSIDYCLDDVVVLKLRFPPTAQFDYRPGQYIDLSYKGVKRSYSIANATSQSKEIELHIRKVPDGKMSKLIFGEIKENQLMRIEGPKGTFFVRDSNRPLILMATGTGIAPIKAIVEDLVNRKDTRNVHIYWGMRYAEEIYCKALESFSREHKHIEFTPVLSRESSAGNFYEGYVQDAVLNRFSCLEGFDVYACGSLDMIEQSKRVFEKKQLPLQAFYSDAFTPAK